jgi:hypothetical protein
MLDMFELKPKSMTSSVFGTPEEEAPALWKKHQAVLREVQCPSCLSELKAAMDAFWSTSGLAEHVDRD